MISLFESAFYLLLDVAPVGWLGVLMLPLLVIAVAIVAAVLLIRALKKKNAVSRVSEYGERKEEGQNK